MGVVYEAEHLRLGQRFELKMLNAEARGEEARFEREARIAARMRSRHAARVYDVDTSEDGVTFLVMEKLDGVTLGTEARDRRLSIEEMCTWMREVCEALQEAHASGIVH